jgi:hypothetical protein
MNNKNDAFDIDELSQNMNYDDERVDIDEDSLYESDIMDDLYDDPDALLDDIPTKKTVEDELKEEKKKRKKEFYVKGSELKEEIQKYHDSKKLTEDRKTE